MGRSAAAVKAELQGLRARKNETEAKVASLRAEIAHTEKLLREKKRQEKIRSKKGKKRAASSSSESELEVGHEQSAVSSHKAKRPCKEDAKSTGPTLTEAEVDELEELFREPSTKEAAASATAESVVEELLQDTTLNQTVPSSSKEPPSSGAQEELRKLLGGDLQTAVKQQFEAWKQIQVNNCGSWPFVPGAPKISGEDVAAQKTEAQLRHFFGGNLEGAIEKQHELWQRFAAGQLPPVATAVPAPIDISLATKSVKKQLKAILDRGQEKVYGAGAVGAKVKKIASGKSKKKSKEPSLQLNEDDDLFSTASDVESQQVADGTQQTLKGPAGGEEDDLLADIAEGADSEAKQSSQEVDSEDSCSSDEEESNSNGIDDEDI
jgi:hypothetical protein